MTNDRLRIHRVKLRARRCFSMMPIIMYGIFPPSLLRATRIPMSPQSIEVVPVLLYTAVPTGMLGAP